MGGHTSQGLPLQDVHGRYKQDHPAGGTLIMEMTGVWVVSEMFEDLLPVKTVEFPV